MRNLPATVNKLNSHRPRAQLGLSTAHGQQIQIFWLAFKTSLPLFPPRAGKDSPFVDVSWFLRVPLIGIEDTSVDPFLFKELASATSTSFIKQKNWQQYKKRLGIDNIGSHVVRSQHAAIFTFEWDKVTIGKAPLSPISLLIILVWKEGFIKALEG